MKATYKQIDQAISNQMEITNDEERNLYEAINGRFYEAAANMKLQKSPEYWTKSDFHAVYKEIKKLIK